ncbi:hypothetical protein A8990_12428 [Paenibacillus taihuensis]|uniref:Uncharacterized protein n=1 Tax=Paenibacillus taihuensis TaxID=1156355 RepID=A0A3D9RPT2_9BACL|nr:hypothetical protein A8990_12428 [Paenibacillus taihuensis]
MIANYKPLIYRKLTTAAITSGIASILYSAKSGCTRLCFTTSLISCWILS